MSRRSPKIRLRMHPTVMAGQTLDAAVLLEVDQPAEVGPVEVTFRGTEARLGSGQGRGLLLLRLSARISSARVLVPGRTELPFKLPLPADLPPSYAGRSARTRYELLVRVRAHGRWAGRQERFEIQVVAATPAQEPAPGSVPGRFTTSVRGPRGSEPFMEGSLGNTNVEPGSVLSGAIALSNVDANRYRRLSVALVAHERPLPGDGRSGVEVKRYVLDLPLHQLREGAPIPFHLAVPADLLPSQRSRLWELVWLLEARAELGWKPDLVHRITLRVLPRRARPSSPLGPQISLPLSVGSPRMEAMWRDVARQNELHLIQERIEGVEGEVQLVVRRERRRRGLFLVGELHYPSLSIELNVQTLRGMQRVLGQPSLPFTGTSWDRRHHVSGRTWEQVSAFGGGVAEAVWGFAGLQMSDEHTLVERRGNGHNRRVLDQFVSNVRQLARAVDASRALIPPPAEMAEAEQPWTDLARRLRGQLNRAAMSVAGETHGMAVEVATEWGPGGAARHTRLMVTPSFPLAARYAFELGPGSSGAEVPELAPEARELVGLLLAGAEGLSVAAQRLLLLLPAPLLAPIPFVSDRVDWLARLHMALSHGGGPYR